MSDMKKFMELSKEYRDLEKVVKKYDEYSLVLNNLQQAKEVLETEKEAELREMAKMELEELTPKREALEAGIKELLMPKYKARTPEKPTLSIRIPLKHEL